MDIQIIGTVALAWLAVFALLQLEHTRWKEVDFKWRYAMGMGTVCLGCLGAGVALNNLALAIVPGLLATAGLTILLSYASENETERKTTAAQKRGELVGRAQGIRKIITQEHIDSGDDPTRYSN